MDAHDRSAQQFLVEWYYPVLTAAPLQQTVAALQAAAASVSAAGTSVRLDLVVAAPVDEVLYGVFGADSADAVQRACFDAGWPPNRITAGIRTHVTARPGASKRRVGSLDDADVPLHPCGPGVAG